MRSRTKKLLLYLILVFFLGGCGGVPLVQETFPTYTINGMNYVSLVSLCNARGIDLDYDTFARTVILKKNTHKINLRVGDTLALVDGIPEHLNAPVDVYQGMLVVPYRFKEKVLDTLYGEISMPARRTLAMSRIKTVVIDAGHGGNDPGTTGRSGLKEKDVNLDISKRLAKLLRDKGIEVVMTRSSDRFIPLEQRVEIANNVKADLFISLHANANRVKSMKGFEVYYITTGISDTRRAINSARSAPPNIDSACFAGSSQNLKAILWDMIYGYNRAESVELARAVCRTIDRDLDLQVLGVKGANYYVLRGAHMPAILIEIGFLSNSNEERLLRNGYYRQQIADAITRGIENYANDFTLMGAAQ